MAAASAPLIVVMGVSGSGKSTVGALLATRLGIPFIDADDLHPIANVEKMAAVIPLDDEDRWPWLARVGGVIAQHEESGVVVACSALKRAYRDAIRQQAPATQFVLLDGPREILLQRLQRRRDHFMPAGLLDSQLAALEPLADGEAGVVIDIRESSQAVLAEAVAKLGEPVGTQPPLK